MANDNNGQPPKTKMVDLGGYDLSRDTLPPMEWLPPHTHPVPPGHDWHDESQPPPGHIPTDREYSGAWLCKRKHCEDYYSSSKRGSCKGCGGIKGRMTAKTMSWDIPYDKKTRDTGYVTFKKKTSFTPTINLVERSNHRRQGRHENNKRARMRLLLCRAFPDMLSEELRPYWSRQYEWVNKEEAEKTLEKLSAELREGTFTGNVTVQRERSPQEPREDSAEEQEDSMEIEQNAGEPEDLMDEDQNDSVQGEESDSNSSVEVPGKDLLRDAQKQAQLDAQLDNQFRIVPRSERDEDRAMKTFFSDRLLRPSDQPIKVMIESIKKQIQDQCDSREQSPEHLVPEVSPETFPDHARAIAQGGAAQEDRQEEAAQEDLQEEAVQEAQAPRVFFNSYTVLPQLPEYICDFMSDQEVQRFDQYADNLWGDVRPRAFIGTDSSLIAFLVTLYAFYTRLETRDDRIFEIAGRVWGLIMRHGTEDLYHLRDEVVRAAQASPRFE